MTGKAFVAAEALPEDWRAGLFLGRIDLGEGPTPVLVSGGIAYDMTAVAATVSELVALKAFDPSAGKPLGDLETLGLSAAVDAPHRLLSPIDLQCVKAAGVTFAVSALERVIEERARGDSSAAAEVRSRIETRIRGGIRTVPGRMVRGVSRRFFRARPHAVMRPTRSTVPQTRGAHRRTLRFAPARRPAVHNAGTAVNGWIPGPVKM